MSNHIFSALSKFLRIDQSQIKNRDVTIENGKQILNFNFNLFELIKGFTRVVFSIDEEEIQFSNSSMLNILKQIIENEKFVIIDLSLKKTIKAINNSFKLGILKFNNILLS